MSLDNVPIPEINMERALACAERIKSALDPSLSKELSIDKLSYLAATMEQQRDQARAEAKLAQDARRASYKKGLVEGLRSYAWWKDGTQYVGTCGQTLNEAINLAMKSVDDDGTRKETGGEEDA